jgi:hypothetical protein
VGDSSTMGSRLKALCWFIEERSPSDRERRSQFLWYVDANAAVPDDQARRSHSSDDAVSAVTVVAGGPPRALPWASSSMQIRHTHEKAKPCLHLGAPEERRATRSLRVRERAAMAER